MTETAFEMASRVLSELGFVNSREDKWWNAFCMTFSVPTVGEVYVTGDRDGRMLVRMEQYDGYDDDQNEGWCEATIWVCAPNNEAVLRSASTKCVEFLTFVRDMRLSESTADIHACA